MFALVRYSTLNNILILLLLTFIFILGGKPEGNKYEMFDTYIERQGVNNCCTYCNIFKAKSITKVRYHLESKHFPGTFNYPCICGKNLKSKYSYNAHIKVCVKFNL